MSSLAVYLFCRRREIIDALVDLLIATVQRINVHSETKVSSDFLAELKRVSGKEYILFKMTEAALEGPDERVSEVIYPAVPGGAETLVAPRSHGRPADAHSGRPSSLTLVQVPAVTTPGSIPH